MAPDGMDKEMWYVQWILPAALKKECEICKEHWWILDQNYAGDIGQKKKGIYYMISLMVESKKKLEMNV